jgi:predicted short-subunit dehydrogenase-like oxidoreductase (DUF2520 family)
MNDKIESINLIGGGNVAAVLYKLLRNKVQVNSVYLRSPKHVDYFAGSKIVNKLDALSKDVDLNIICVADDSIREVSSGLPMNIPSVHTSGAVSLLELANQDVHGVIYPFQTISKNRTIDLLNVPVFVEANSELFELQLKYFVDTYLSNKVSILSSEKRAKVHLAGVFANNFTTVLIGTAQNILEDNNLNRELLIPLLEETIAKISDLGSDLAQTGPARRGDKKTMQVHLSLIKNEDQIKLYELLSEVIASKFKL